MIELFYITSNKRLLNHSQKQQDLQQKAHVQYLLSTIVIPEMQRYCRHNNSLMELKHKSIALNLYSRVCHHWYKHRQIWTICNKSLNIKRVNAGGGDALDSFYI